MDTIQFKDFESLFRDAVNHGLIDGLEQPKPCEDITDFYSEMWLCGFIFTRWLHEKNTVETFKDVRSCICDFGKYINCDSGMNNHPCIRNYEKYLTRENFGKMLKWRGEVEKEREREARREYGIIEDEGVQPISNDRKMRLKRSEYLDLPICEFIEHVYKYGMTDFEMRDWINNSCKGNRKLIQELYNEVIDCKECNGEWCTRLQYKDEYRLFTDTTNDVMFLECFLSVIEDEAKNAGMLLNAFDEECNNNKKKPVKSFLDFLRHDNKNALMAVLHKELDNQKGGKYIALCLEALEIKGCLEKGARIVPIMKTEFSIQCSDTAINKKRGIRRNQIEKDEIQRIVNILP